jgi:hypothetical protein
MKTTVVPAQITTIEDRIAGNLGLSQLMLLSVPVFVGGALYMCLPPIMHGSLFKIGLFGLLLLSCSLLAIRIKGKIVLVWLSVIVRYNLRPRYYVFDKNIIFGRNTYKNNKAPEENNEKELDPVVRKPRKLLAANEIVSLHNILDNPAANLTFKNMKGDLRVLITEIEK